MLRLDAYELRIHLSIGHIVAVFFHDDCLRRDRIRGYHVDVALLRGVGGGLIPA
jgi:hypothetical protein